MDLPVMERFFGALLRPCVEDHFAAYEKFTSGDAKSHELWQTIVASLAASPENDSAAGSSSSTVPETPLLDQYPTVAEHFQARASLVVEEARHLISEGLVQNWCAADHHQQIRHEGQITVQATLEYSSSKNKLRRRSKEYKEDCLGHAKIQFEKTGGGSFTPQQLSYIRAGMIYECMPSDAPQHILEHCLLCVVLSANRDRLEKDGTFEVLFSSRCKVTEKANHGITFTLTPVTHLISQLRWYEAVTCDPHSIAFLHDLMGWSKDDNDDHHYHQATKSCESHSEGYHNKLPQYDSFQYQSLNRRQREVVTQFLNAAPNSITLAQGPPGTGTCANAEMIDALKD